MGITNFQKNIKEKYSEAFKKKWLKVYDHVYIDINFAFSLGIPAQTTFLLSRTKLLNWSQPNGEDTGPWKPALFRFLVASLRYIS